MLASIIDRQNDKFVLAKWILTQQIIRMVQFTVKLFIIQELLVFIEKVETMRLQGFYLWHLFSLVPKLRIVREDKSREEIVEYFRVDEIIFADFFEIILRDCL